MLGAMGWLGFSIIPRAGPLFARLEQKTDTRWGWMDLMFTIKKPSSFFQHLVWLFFPILRGRC